MWAETCKYLSVIHSVNHRRRRQRHRRGRGKGTEETGGRKKRGVKNKRVGEDECEEGTFYLEDASRPY